MPGDENKDHTGDEVISNNDGDVIFQGNDPGARRPAAAPTPSRMTPTERQIQQLFDLIAGLKSRVEDLENTVDFQAEAIKVLEEKNAYPAGNSECTKLDFSLVPKLDKLDNLKDWKYPIVGSLTAVGYEEKYFAREEVERVYNKRLKTDYKPNYDKQKILDSESPRGITRYMRTTIFGKIFHTLGKDVKKAVREKIKYGDIIGIWYISTNWYVKFNTTSETATYALFIAIGMKKNEKFREYRMCKEEEARNVEAFDNPALTATPAQLLRIVLAGVRKKYPGIQYEVSRIEKLKCQTPEEVEKALSDLQEAADNIETAEENVNVQKQGGSRGGQGGQDPAQSRRRPRSKGVCRSWEAFGKCTRPANTCVFTHPPEKCGNKASGNDSNTSTTSTKTTRKCEFCSYDHEMKNCRKFKAAKRKLAEEHADKSSKSGTKVKASLATTQQENGADTHDESQTHEASPERDEATRELDSINQAIGAIVVNESRTLKNDDRKNARRLKTVHFNDRNSDNVGSHETMEPAADVGLRITSQEKDLLKKLVSKLL